MSTFNLDYAIIFVVLRLKNIIICHLIWHQHAVYLSDNFKDRLKIKNR